MTSTNFQRALSSSPCQSLATSAPISPRLSSISASTISPSMRLDQTPAVSELDALGTKAGGAPDDEAAAVATAGAESSKKADSWAT
jgi:hypothetical protein